MKSKFSTDEKVMRHKKKLTTGTAELYTVLQKYAHIGLNHLSDRQPSTSLPDCCLCLCSCGGKIFKRFLGSTWVEKAIGISLIPRCHGTYNVAMNSIWQMRYWCFTLVAMATKFSWQRGMKLIVLKNLHTNSGLNMTWDKGVTDVSLWSPW